MTRTKSKQLYIRPKERSQIDRFVSAFNVIEQCLREILNRDKQTSFAKLVNEFTQTGRLSNGDAAALKSVSQLRNFLVHEMVEPSRYPAVPTTVTVERIEALRDRILHPEFVIPKFKKAVETILVHDSLSAVLKQIAQRDYSQFPVYDGPTFKGLLTENGITRWLAIHVSTELSLIELEDVSVRDVLKEEAKRPDCQFVSRTTTTEQVKASFAQQELLEALLITNTGHRREELLGIVTRWDVVHLRR